MKKERLGSRSNKLKVGITVIAVGSTAIAAMVLNLFNPAISYATIPGVNDLVSVSSSGVLENAQSYALSNSGDGRYVAFSSTANNLVTGDTNNTQDVFVRDLTNGTTERVSVSTSGTEANSSSGNPKISYDGRYVVFSSYASNLDSGDTNGTYDVFMRDRLSNTTALVSKTAAGVVGNNPSQSPVVSADGRFVAFQSGASNLVSSSWINANQIFLKDMSSSTITAVSVNNSTDYVGNASSGNPSISCDGGVVAFSTHATNLVAGDPYESNPNSTSNYDDIIVSVQGIGGQVLKNITLDAGANYYSSSPSVSCDGDKLALMGPGNLSGNTDNSCVYRYDRLANSFAAASVNNSGTTQCLGNGSPSISGDGRYVAFDSDSSSYGISWRQVILRDMNLSTTQVVPQSSSFVQGNGYSNLPSISADGAYVSYGSQATNLVTGDTNGWADVYRSKTGN